MSEKTILDVVEPPSGALSGFVRQSGIDIRTSLVAEQLPSLETTSRPPDVLVIDLRGGTSVPATLASLRRRHPRIGMVIVADSLDPTLMLEAMRAGVNEFVTEPLSEDSLRAAIERVVGHQLAPAGPGNVLAFMGAKGGVGTTTLAVNVATALAEAKTGPVLMLDLHVAAHGDVALLLGVEPKFSVVDALENTNRLDASYLKSLVVRSKAGLDVLASPERPSLRPPDAVQVKTLLSRVAELYSAVVIDVPRTDFGVVDALEPLTAITLVVNQELPTVRRAAQVGALLRQRYGKDRVGTVVSRYDARADIGQEDIERVVGLPVWAALPSDYRKVLAAANAGRPLVSDNHSRLAASVVQLATRLSGAAGQQPKPKPSRSVGRLGGFFN